jgi:hypothetical protein
MSKPRIGIQLSNFDRRVGLDEMPLVHSELQNQITFAPLWWGEVEKAPGEYDWEAMDWWAGVDGVLPSLPQRIWTIYPVHMNERGVLPPDLQDAPFDRPDMLDRFESFVAEAARRGGWNDGDTVVMLGNELDMWAARYPEEVPAFVRFVNEGADAIRRHAPEARVVNSLTLGVLDEPGGADLVKAVNENADLLALQWYDLRPDFTIRRLSDLGREVDRMLAIAAGRPLLISEIGLPTHGTCLSSERLQAERVAELFAVLDGYGRHEIEGAVWLGLDDWPVEVLEPYVAQQFPELVGNAEFLCFLTSLGLRDRDGNPKEGYRAWKDCAGRRA